MMMLMMTEKILRMTQCESDFFSCPCQGCQTAQGGNDWKPHCRLWRGHFDPKNKKTPKYSQHYGDQSKTVQMSILLSAMSLSCTFWLLWMQLRTFFGDCLDVLEWSWSLSCSMSIATKSHFEILWFVFLQNCTFLSYNFINRRRKIAFQFKCRNTLAGTAIELP